MLQSVVWFASAFLFQVGGRTMPPIELTPAQRALLKSPIAKHLILFSGMYITVRSFFGACFLYAIAVLLLFPQYGLLSEHSPLNILPEWARREGFEASKVERERALPKPISG